MIGPSVKIFSQFVFSPENASLQKSSTTPKTRGPFVIISYPLLILQIVHFKEAQSDSMQS